MNPPPTSLRSIKSVPSNKSGKSYATSNASDNDEVDFELLMIELYKRYSCPVVVAVGKEYACRDRGTRTLKSHDFKTKYRRVSVIEAPPETPLTESNKDEFEFIDTDAENTLAITAIYDSARHLSEILITKFQQQVIPRIVIQLLGLVLPSYPHLTKLTIKNCHIDTYTVHEISRVLPFSTITEVCLDDCPLKQANYHELLNSPSCLKNLSLCRCQINYEACERIASKLCYLESAEENLVALNLTSNLIGDVGVKHLADALRSNRHLRYLNLADNLISDKGMEYLFNVLTEFPLTDDENIDRRHRFMRYLKKKRDIYLDCLKKLGHQPQNKSLVSSSQSRSHINLQRRSTSALHKREQLVKNKVIIKKERTKSCSLDNEDNIPMKAELMARQLTGPFEGPFDWSGVKIENGFPICIGNFSLCYLNVAYNDLTYESVKNLLSVVEYQHVHYKLDMCGLMKVILVGNYLPASCIELTTISHMLNKHMACFHHSKLTDRSSSTRKYQRH